MATITLYAGKVNQMSSLINHARKAVKEYKSDLKSLKSKVLSIDESICDVDDVISSIKSSTQTQEDKIESLESLKENINEYISDVMIIDQNAADAINKSKNDFYDKYECLKPDIEKSWLEEKWDSACEWCKENWQSIVSVFVTIVIVVGIVILSISTFGTAIPVIAVGVVGAIVGISGQLISDIISCAITGDWDGNWQSYIGSAIGGFAGGVLLLLTNPIAACSAEAAISTFFGENLENITGGQKRSTFEILFDTGLSTGTAAFFSVALSKITGKLSKTLSKKIPVFKRLSGINSYDASFKMVITKLKQGSIKKFHYKTIRNGVISGLSGGALENIASGFLMGLRNGMTNGESCHKINKK